MILIEKASLNLTEQNSNMQSCKTLISIFGLYKESQKADRMRPSQWNTAIQMMNLMRVEDKPAAQEKTRLIPRKLQARIENPLFIVKHKTICSSNLSLIYRTVFKHLNSSLRLNVISFLTS